MLDSSGASAASAISAGVSRWVWTIAGADEELKH